MFSNSVVGRYWPVCNSQNNEKKPLVKKRSKMKETNLTPEHVSTKLLNTLAGRSVPRKQISALKLEILASKLYERFAD